ncbi:MAG: hypothetical protein L6R41_007753, partial [Letrouitia leprolyta]
PPPPPPPLVPPGFNRSPAPTSASYGQQFNQDMSQGYQDSIGNLTSRANQQWNEPNNTAASQRRRSRGQ